MEVILDRTKCKFEFYDNFSLFCKLAATLRTKITAFGHDINISVRCLQVLVKAVDARSVCLHVCDILDSHLVEITYLPF